jgi:hypothetical protein
MMMMMMMMMTTMMIFILPSGIMGTAQPNEYVMMSENYLN